MFYWICLVLVVAPLVVERLLTEHRRRSIPVRVHVHGTRGKSSTVRILAQMLRDRNLTVLAKTTGDAPEYVLPDGRVERIRRIGPPRIHEHVAVLKRAAALGADVVVVEGMALAPETVWHSQEILRATHAVITNTRPDHAESMGAGRRGVLRTLSRMIPEGRELFTGDEEGAPELAEIAALSNCAVTLVEAPYSRRQPLRLANAVADRIAPLPDVTFAGDLPRDSAPEWTEFECGGIAVRFLDLFSANDVETSAALWSERRPDPERLRVALLATRADRPLRTRDLLVRLLVDESFDVILPLGGHAGFVWLAAAGERRLMKLFPWRRPSAVVTRLCRDAAAGGRRGIEIVGIGNCHGIGERWRDMLDRKNDHAR